MIDARELRIGNWVVMESEYYQIIYGTDIDEYSEDFSPIPLTKEILLKCGFAWNESIKHYQIMWGKNGMHFIKEEPYYKGFGLQLGEGHYKIIFHLHQLQNLYYALTQSELEIKL